MGEGRRYKIEGVLGKGGFGTVYRAQLLGEGGFTRKVALKVLNADMAGMEDVARRLRDEARLLGLLRHRAILHVDGLVRLNNRWTVVMEYIEGKALNPSHLEHHTTHGRRAFLIHLLQMLRGCHRRGECHGDIKPSNLLIDPTGQVHLLDWGSARLHDDPAQEWARESSSGIAFVSTPQCMAPERLFGLKLGIQADLYSLGMAFLAALGRAPNRSKQQMSAVLHAHPEDPLLPLKPLALDDVLDAKTASTVRRMISINAHHRPTSCEEALTWIAHGPTTACAAQTGGPCTRPTITAAEVVDGGQVLVDTGDHLVMYRKVDGGFKEVDVLAVPKHWEVAMVDLLNSVFGDQRALREHFPATIRDHLPSPSVPITTGAPETVAVLLRTGAITTAFFDTLLQECPARGVEIRAVQRRWQAAMARSEG